MTCKDCFLYQCEICDGYIPTDFDKDIWHYCAQGKQDKIPDIEERCSSFKLKSRIVELPCAVGDTVYHIAECGNFHAELDGTLYDSLGGIGSATGYYCPCELRNNCPFDPFDNEEDFDCEKQKSKLAIFEDEVKGFIVGEYEETIILLDYTGNEYIHNFGKTVFLSREEAEKALKEKQR